MIQDIEILDSNSEKLLTLKVRQSDNIYVSLDNGDYIELGTKRYKYINKEFIKLGKLVRIYVEEEVNNKEEVIIQSDVIIPNEKKGNKKTVVV